MSSGIEFSGESKTGMEAFTLRVVGGEDSIPIARVDFERLRGDLTRLKRRLDAEFLFDHLAENVVEWREAMTRFVVRSQSAGPQHWLKDMTECRLLLRIANVLSAAFSFTENVDHDDAHKKYRCGTPMCTIARGLRNRIQHGIVESRHVTAGHAVWISAPQMKSMPSNGIKDGVHVMIRWRDLLDDMRRYGRGRFENACRRFEDACRREFPNSDTVDAVIVINSHLNCLSDVMKEHRQRWPVEGTLDKAHELLQKASSLESSLVHAEAPDGESIWIKDPGQLCSSIEDLTDRNERIADVELVQFGAGSPTHGDLGLLKQRIHSLLDEPRLAGIAMAEVAETAETDLPALATSNADSEKVVETVDRLYDSTKRAAGSLWEAALALRRIESGLTDVLSKRTGRALSDS